ncbi:hypothetical protein AB5J56_04715 [Streptomyces sp. R21]|uniref:Uncharacterized protein n=1 Tax=Streptomyces sp. R21 TaxID=3238627 RepID=A0AB39NZI3_9ACTN
MDPDLRDAYTRFGDAFPRQQMELQPLCGDAQRAFQDRTRRGLKATIQSVLRNVLCDQRLGDKEPSEYLIEYLDREIDRIEVRLNQDGELAVARGLNFGLGLGVALLLVPLLFGEKLLGAIGVTLNCTDRWSLTGALVCGGVGAYRVFGGWFLAMATYSCSAPASSPWSTSRPPPQTCAPRTEVRPPPATAPPSGNSGAPSASWRASTSAGCTACWATRPRTSSQDRAARCAVRPNRP